MAIITISRGSYSRGKEVAEKVAARLGYDCISREVLLEASQRFRIPEIKLVRAIHDAPTILKRFNHDKRAYVAYVQSALTRCVAKGDVVYHGLAGHLLLKGVPHVLKVRIIARMEDRVESEVAREGIGEQEARALIEKDDEERRKWTKSLYGVDPWDSSLYDLVIRIHKLQVDDAVDFICRAAELDRFKATRESQQKMDDLALACEVKAGLVEQGFDVFVRSTFGNVVVYTKAGDRRAQRIDEAAAALKQGIPGLYHIEVHFGMAVPDDVV